MLYAWKDDYSVGVATLDTQHKRLFELIGELYGAMKLGQSREILARIVDELVAYADAHFYEEEVRMEAAGYVGLVAHRQAHDAFRVKVHGHQAALRRGLSAGVSIDVFEYLRDWLVSHILTVDKAMTAAIREGASRRSADDERPPREQGKARGG